MESTKMGRILVHNLNTKKSYFEANKSSSKNEKLDSENGRFEIEKKDLVKNNESFLNINHDDENILNESFEGTEKKKTNCILYPENFKYYIICKNCGILLSSESKNMINLVLR
jgi:hypothetical protein